VQKIGLSLSLLLLTSCASTPQSSSVPSEWVPFELVRNSMRLDLTVKDKTFPALVDSGASDSMIDKALAKELIIRPVGYSQIRSMGDKALVGYASNIYFEVKDTKLKSSTITITDLSHFDFKVLLGYNAIQSKVWEIDFPRNRVRFYEKSNYKYQGSAAKITTFHRPDRLYLNLEVDGIRRQVLFDTGAALPLLLAATADEITALKKQNITPGVIKGGRNERMDVWKKPSKEIKIGSYSFNDIPTAYFEKTHNGFNDEGIMGLPFVKDFVVTIDTQNEAIYLDKPSS
jgi:predicted aspartyl protease